MAVNENYSDIASGNGHGSLSVLHPIHEAAMRIAAGGLDRCKAQTPASVAGRLSHGARAWRSNQPEANIHLHVASRSGRAPVHIRIR